MTRIVLTYDDYAALPDDGKRYELHEGELVVTPSPGTLHQQVSARLTILLGGHVWRNDLGELLVAPYDCIVSDITVVQPDIIYLDESRARLLSDRALEGAPTLAVEIVIPSTEDVDRHTKPALYARHDVPWYWIVDPSTCTIEVYGLDGTAYRLDATLEGAEPRALRPLDDLVLAPADVWRGLR
jgi:Uma2 family endonuclease